jgi:hypothetical protein
MEQTDRVKIPAHIHSRKYHGKVGRGRKLRLLVLVPQLNVAELNSDKEDKEEEDCSATDKEPREVEGDLATPIDEGAVRAFRVLVDVERIEHKKMSEHEHTFLCFG